jgi:hypothetical protein
MCGWIVRSGITSKLCVMKKVLVLVAALLVCFVVTAQNSRLSKKNSSSVFFTIGPAFPIGDFSSTDANNLNAGYANTGVNLNLNYDYMFQKYVGITVDVMYGSHKMDHKIISDFMGLNVPGADINHYQYVGLLVGPVLNGTITPKADINFKLLGGVGRTRSPEATFDGEIFAKQDWASSFAWKISSDAQVRFSKKGFFVIGISYLQMRPDFNIVLMPNETNPETLSMEMHVSTINLNAGVGIKF